jgi:hypothetical protein
MNKAGKPPKPKKCDTRKGGCGQTFTPSRPMQCACGVPCSIAMAGKARDKKAAKAATEDRKATKAKLIELKPLKWFHAQTKRVVHLYIRTRDAHLPCISCGTMHAPQWDAGHYKSVGANSSLRYDTANIHKQCSRCNKELSANLILYRQNLIPKIGEAEVLRLEGPQPVHKWTREELEAIKAEYSAKTRALNFTIAGA